MEHEFQIRLNAAREAVETARAVGDRRTVANALKQLADIERRVPALRPAANGHYEEIVEIYRGLGEPLEIARALRHIGISHEYAGLLDEAEKYYDESLELFREHAADDDINYANTVRYPAVIKERLGKRDESCVLWEEAVRRYGRMNEPLGVAEGSAWLALFADDNGDPVLARQWLEKAETAASEARDADTDKWVAEVREKLNAASS